MKAPALVGTLAVGWLLLATPWQDGRAQERASPAPRPDPLVPSPDAAPAQNALPKPYRDAFFNNDFSYLDAPGYVSHDPFDALKRIEAAPGTLLDLGGECRLRYHGEDNLRLDGRDNDYMLQRTRLYADVRHEDWLRFYGELIDSTIAFNRLPPRASEEDRADVLNLFVDARLGQAGAGALWARVGRQELDYGNQRLVAAAEWANDRITFDGVKLFWKDDKGWDVDAFWTRPVPFARIGDGAEQNFRPADPTEQFMGLYAVYHGLKDQTVDLYFLRLERDRPAARGDPPLVRFDANTLGGRWQGRRGDWLWEAEGGFQLGRFAGDGQAAGFSVTGVGYQWKRLLWAPTAWLYYDWASGDADPADGRRGTFNQFFAQTHRFLGEADIVGRQNVEDLNFLLTAKPHDRLTLIAEGHLFRLAQARDALYSNGGTAVRFDPTGAAGADLGRELDFTARARLNLHAELLVTYGHFFAGRFLARTGVGADSDFVYTQLGFKF